MSVVAVALVLAALVALLLRISDQARRPLPDVSPADVSPQASAHTEVVRIR